MKNYPGAKGNSGIIQFFINKIPFHNRYFEPFAGSAQLFRNKKPGIENYLNDLNVLTVNKLERSFIDILTNPRKHLLVSNWDIFTFLQMFDFIGSDFIYLDPPYIKEDRRSGASIYKFEMLEAEQHLKLLAKIKLLNANIMISTGQNELYQEQLKYWERFEFKTIGHKGPRIEVIYMNYEKPKFLYQYDHFGENFTRRQQIKRISERFRDRLSRIDPYEAHIIIQDIIRDNPEAIKHFIDKV